ncbi:MAG: isoprenylcysteine carboxylmethyltransferase family protein [Candidatus Nanohaloarchaea archaeon]
MDMPEIDITRRTVIMGVLAGYSLLFLPLFADYFIYYMSGQVISTVIEGQWSIVLLNIGAFLLFLIPLHYRRKANWKSMGVYSAFIVSLFIEMYGVPLTLYIGSAVSTQVPPPATVYSLGFLGVVFNMSAWMILGIILTAIGAAAIAKGWHDIYFAEEELVTKGVYRYSRHPQYVGILLVVLGWWIAWPTPLTTLMLPVMVYTYYSLAKEEEKEVSEEIGEEKYTEYAENTPMFV